MEGAPAFADVLARAKKDGKPVFIDFQVSWCSWCRKLETDVFAKPSVGELMKGFVNVSYDAEKGLGKELAERFRVRGFPTLVIVDAGGSEIDRIEGFRESDAFTKEIERILKGKETLPALKQRVAAAPDDLAAAMVLARKLDVTAPADAVVLLEKVVEKAKGKDHAFEAEACISLARAARNANDPKRADAACNRVLTEFGDTDCAMEALQAMIPVGDADAALAFLSKTQKSCKNAKVSAFADAVIAEAHLQAAATALTRRAEVASDDPQALNEIAWTCFERNMNLKAAVGWARTAVEKSMRDPSTLDTLANLLFATGQTEEAVKIEQEALDGAKAEPEKSAFGETLAKFKAVEAFRSAHPVAKAACCGRDEEGSEGCSHCGGSAPAPVSGPAPALK